MKKASEVKLLRVITKEQFPMLEFLVETVPIRFSVAMMPVDKQVWLRDVLGRQLQVLYADAYNAGKKDTRQAYEKFLEAMEGEA